MTCWSRSLAYGRSAGKSPRSGYSTRVGRAEAGLKVLRRTLPIARPFLPANHVQLEGQMDSGPAPLIRAQWPVSH